MDKIILGITILVIAMVSLFAQPVTDVYAVPSDLFIPTIFNPQSIAFDSAGNLYVVAGTVRQYDSAGNLLDADFAPGLSVPRSIALDSAGNLYVADAGFDTVRQYDSAGNLLDADFAPGLFFPQSIALDSAGNLYVVAGTVRQYDSAGNLLDADFAPGLSVPRSIALDSAGNLYVADIFLDTVRQYDSAGNLLDASFVTGLSNIQSIALDSAGNLYVADLTRGIFTTNPDLFPSSGNNSETRDGGGSSDQEWKNKPTFGLSHQTHNPLVKNGLVANGKSFDITDNWHTDFETQTILVGEKNTFTAKAYAPHGLQSLEFMFGIPEVGQAYNAEAAVEVWLNRDLSIQEIKIVQKDNLINKDSVTASSEMVPCTDSDTVNNCYSVEMSASLNEPPINQIFALKGMDFTRRVHTTHFNDGFAVQGDSLNPPKTVLVASGQKGTGLIHLTQIDKKSDLWVDEHGYQWTKNQFDTWLQLTKPEFQRHHDDEMCGVMTRDNSNFAVLVENEKDKAKRIFDSALLQK